MQFVRDTSALACDAADALAQRRVVPSDAPRDQLRESPDVVREPRCLVHRSDPPVRDQRTEPQARGRLRFRKCADDDQVRAVGDER